jgi:hypothetical protein
MADPNAVVDLSADSKLELIGAKVTCPFVGSAVNEGVLPVRHDAANPLADIDELRALGNQEEGDLGEVFVFFATGSHTFMRDDSGQLTRPVPDGLFSLDFPESRGSHPGDSGILQRDTKNPQFSRDDFDRLASRAQDGRLTRRAVGDFIAENVHRDPNARTIGREVVLRMGQDLFALFEAVVPAPLRRVVRLTEEAGSAHRRATQRLTKLLSEDHLAGSSGEFGLLFTLLSRPDTLDEDGEPFLLLEEVEMMFQQKRLPAGWDKRRKTRIDWAKHTFALLLTAYESYARRKKKDRET